MNSGSRVKYRHRAIVLIITAGLHFMCKKCTVLFHIGTFLLMLWHRLFAQGRIILGISFALMIQIILSLKLKCAAI